MNVKKIVQFENKKQRQTFNRDDFILFYTDKYRDKKFSNNDGSVCLPERKSKDRLVLFVIQKKGYD